MKVEIIDGCELSVSVDGTDVRQMSSYGLQQVVKHIAERVGKGTLVDMLIEAATSEGKSKTIGYCTTCHSWNEQYILEV